MKLNENIFKIVALLSQVIAIWAFFEKILNIYFLILIISVGLLVWFWYYSQKREINIFISIPILSCGKNEQYQQIRNTIIQDIILPLKSKKQLTVDSTVIEISEIPDNRRLPDTKNFKKIRDCTCFVLICPKDIIKPSSIFVEAGYALALKKKTLIFYSNPDNIPELLQIIEDKFPTFGRSAKFNECYKDIYGRILANLAIEE